MKKEWLLLIGSVSLTLITALLLIRWFAPQLLGLPVDLQMVRVSKEVVPFFDGVFRPEDHETGEYIIQDPYIMRAKPLFPGFMRVGPNDILGFRNRSVPNIADIIAIGDSQTYGNNVFLEENWPSVMMYDMKEYSPVLYNMAVGGWGAAEYFEIFNKALYLQPKVVIIAFYSGNDAIDTFNKVYSDERWKELRLDPKLSSSDVPGIADDIEWQVKFNDGTGTGLTPGKRSLSNRRDYPAVKAGYAIMGKIAQKIGDIARAAKIKLVYTIIPTKELAYEKRIMEENIPLREDYAALVENERENIEFLTEQLRNIPDTVYVDLLKPLQDAVKDTLALYSPDRDGHPIAGGYKLIGETIREEVIGLLPEEIQGGVIAQISVTDDNYRPLLIKDGYFYSFESVDITGRNGWDKGNIRMADLREINRLKYAGIISTVDPARFGPMAFGRN